MADEVQISITVPGDRKVSVRIGGVRYETVAANATATFTLDWDTAYLLFELEDLEPEEIEEQEGS